MARAEVKRRKDGGAQLIKATHPPLAWSLLRAVIDEAHQQGLPVVGHGFKGIEEIIKSVTLGYSSLEHTTTPGRLYDDVLQLLAASSTRWDPTLMTRGSFVVLRDEPERLHDAKLQAFTPQWAIRQAKTLRYYGGLPTSSGHTFTGSWNSLSKQDCRLWMCSASPPCKLRKPSVRQAISVVWSLASWRTWSCSMRTR